MNHRRVAQEKNRLITDIQRLKKHCTLYEPTIQELRAKYEAAMKEKMLIRLERDRLVSKVRRNMNFGILKKKKIATPDWLLM